MIELTVIIKWYRSAVKFTAYACKPAPTMFTCKAVTCKIVTWKIVTCKIVRFT